MIQTRIQISEAFHWLDIINPSADELQKIADEYGLHATSVQDCLDPEHLPKYERFENLHFMILRGYDQDCSADADNIQELTRKVAVFYQDHFLMTVHRRDQDFFEKLREKWKSNQEKKNLPHLLFIDLARSVIHSYEKPIDQALDDLEALEMGVFGADGGKLFAVEDAYYLKRKGFVFKRMLKLSLEVIGKLTSELGVKSPRLQNLKEEAEALFFFADELMENISGLLNLHISLASQKTNEASHRTNEIVRVLTIFSMFFFPLNLITGIYGMNFEHMPELHSRWGYPIALLSMIAISSGVYLWFKKKGWLGQQ